MTTPTNTVTELQKPNPSEIIELFEIYLDQRLHYPDWQANTAYTAGDTVSSTGLIFETNTTNLLPPTPMVFECSSSGTSGGSLPNFNVSNTSPSGQITNGATVSDNNITWTAKRAVKRFHAGTNLKTTTSLHEASIHFDGKVFEPFPVIAEGFAQSSSGTLPRPRLTISNVNPSLATSFSIANGGSAFPSGTISAMMLEVNKVTVGNDLIGSILVRIRTLRKFLPSENFNSTKSTADSSQKFPDDIFMIVRKVVENKEIVQFECAMQNDNFGIRLPRRQILPSDFPAIGEFFQ